MSTQAERERLRGILDAAVDAGEVRAAAESLKRFLEKHPEDEGKDIAHGFHLAWDGLQVRERQARELALEPDEVLERERVRKAAVIAAEGDPESPDFFGPVTAAEQNLRAWAERFPSDPLPAELLGLLEGKARDARMTQEALRMLREEEVGGQVSPVS
jgi:hypothetical protein